MTQSDDNNKLRVGIIGVGPVGATLAVHLKVGGAFVVLCDVLPDRMSQMKQKGIRLTHTIEKEAPIDEACCSVQELGGYNLDLIVLCVKTPVLPSVVNQLKEIDTGKTFYMCAQNGIDNELELAHAFGEDRTLRMIVNYAGHLSDETTVGVAFFNPPNYVAALGTGGAAMADKFADLLSSAGLKTSVPDDIRTYVWEKAILNAALSAICAITGRTMKQVMDFPSTLELVEGIVDESVGVAEKENIELAPGFRQFCVRYLKNAGHHRPSMWADLENGNPTEIDHLNGMIAQYGRKHGLPTPLNQSVTALVHLLEQNPD